MQVAEWITLGDTYREVAERLGISVARAQQIDRRAVQFLTSRRRAWIGDLESFDLIHRRANPDIWIARIAEIRRDGY